MRIVADSQLELLRSTSIRPLTMVKIVAVTGEVFYLSSVPFRYDYDGAGAVQFLDVVSDFGTLVEEIEHIEGGGPLNILQPWVLDLSNEVVDGQRFAKTVSVDVAIEGATIEVAQLLISDEPSAFESDRPEPSTDKTILRRGIIQQVQLVDDERVQLRCVRALPSMPWTYATGADDVLAGDLGRRLPIPYGSVRVAAVPVVVGQSSPLVADIDEAATSLIVADGSIYPSSGSIRIGREEMTYTTVTDDVISGITRATANSAAVRHKTGERVVIVKDEQYAIGTPLKQVSAVDAVWALSPVSGELVKLTAGTHYGISLFGDIQLVTVNVTQSRAIAKFLTLGDVVAEPAPTVSTENVVFIQQGANVVDLGGALGGLSLINGIPDDFFAQLRFQQTHVVQFPGGDASGIPPDSTSMDPDTWIVSQKLRVYFHGNTGGSSQFADACPNYPPVEVESLMRFHKGGAAATDPGWYELPVGDPTVHQFSITTEFSAGTSHINFGEVEREVTYQREVITSEVVEVQALSFPLELYVDVQGPVAPGEVAPTWSQIFDFESGSGWTNAVLDTTIFVEGSGSIRMDIDESHLSVNEQGDSDEASEWVGLQGSSVADDTGVSTDGSSVRVDSDGATGDASAEASFSPPLSFTNQRLVMNVRWSGDPLPTTPGFQSLRVTVLDGSGGSSTWSFDMENDVPFETWKILCIDLTEATAGNVDPSDVVTVRVSADSESPGLTAVTALDDAAGWSAVDIGGETETLIDDGTINHDGSSSVKTTSTWNFGGGMIAFQTMSLDMSNGEPLQFWFRYAIADDDAGAGDLLRIRLGNSGPGFPRLRQAALDLTLYAEDTWYQIVLDPLTLPVITTEAPDLSDVDYFLIEIVLGSGADTATLISIWVDEVMVESNTPTPSDRSVWIDELRVVAEGGIVASKGSLGGLDWTSVDSRYRARTRADHPNVRTGIIITTGASFTFYVLPRMVDADTWYQAEAVFNSQFGSPDLSNVTQISLSSRMQLGTFVHDYSASGITWSVWWDDLELLADAGDPSGYSVPSDSLLIHPVDVFRHFIQEILGRAVDEQSLSSALLNLLPGFSVSIDLRTWGLTVQEILGRFAYETRSNIVVEDDNSGQYWRMLCADRNFTFPSSTLRVRVYDRGGLVSQSRPAQAEISTRYTFYHGFDPSLAIYSDLAFRGYLRAAPDGSDIPKVSAANLTAAELRYGVQEAQPEALHGVADSASAKDVAGFRVVEKLRNPYVIAVSGAVWYDDDLYLAQVGDTRIVTLPWDPNTNIKSRLVSRQRSLLNEQLELRLVEVL